MTFATWFSRARKSKGYSQRDIANQLQYGSGQFVYAWEKAKSYPSKAAIPRIAKLLGEDTQTIKRMILDEKIADLKKEWMG